MKNQIIKNNHLYKIGDAIGFTPGMEKYPTKCLGTIVKLNPKRAKVKCLVSDVLGVWTVSYSYLQPLTKEEKILLSVKVMIQSK